MEAHTTFVSQHAFFALSDTVKTLAMPLEKYLKINYFTFKRTFADNSKIYLFNNPTYFKHYFKKEYFLIENCEGPINKYMNNYELWDYLPDPFHIYQEAAEDFNIGNGLVLTQQHHHYCDFFFFASTPENIQVKSLYLNHRHVFEKFIQHFLKEGRKLIQQAEKHKVILPYGGVPLHIPGFQLAEFYQDIRHLPFQKLDLSKREREHVYYLTQGYSNQEISLKLNISVRTVEDHIAHLRQKMHCENRTALIAKLFKHVKH